MPPDMLLGLCLDDTSKERTLARSSARSGLRGGPRVYVLVACPRFAICCLPFVANDKLPQITADDRIQPLWLLRVHGKPLHGYAFVTVAALLILGLMAVVLLFSPQLCVYMPRMEGWHPRALVCRLFRHLS